MGGYELYEAQPVTEGVGGVLMKHNLVHRGSAEYNVGLLSILGKIMGRGKGYTSSGGTTVTTMVSEDYTNQKLVARVPRSQPGKLGVVPDEILVAFPSAWPAGLHDVSFG